MSITNTIDRLATVDLDILAAFDDGQEEAEPDFVVELIDLYLAEAPRMLKSIREGLATRDWLSARRAAHSLRGSSSNLGILQTAAIAGEVEQLAAKHESAAEQLLPDLEVELSHVQQILLNERHKRIS